MWLYWFKRFFLAFPIAFGVVTLTFFLIHWIPGDPTELILGDQVTPIERETLRKELGLEDPLWKQYVHYLSNIAQLDLGRSFYSHRPVGEHLLERFPASLELTLAALLIALFAGVPLGVFSALKRERFEDHILMLSSFFFLSIPGIFLSPLLIWIFALQLDWFPVSERGGFEHLILPALSLALPLGSVLMRISRTSLLGVLKEDYIRTGWSKGLSSFRVYFKHALLNAFIPVVTVFGLQMGALLTGAVITETIFDWPGLGTLLLSAIQSRDYPLVQGCILFVSFIYVFVNLITDLTYAFFDPRVRVSS